MQNKPFLIRQIVTSTMPKISYPFVALPNSIVRGGHGPRNLSVLLTIMSHGRCTASSETIADEAGCDVKSVRAAIKYWQENGPKHGLQMTVSTRLGTSNVINVIVDKCDDSLLIEIGDSEMPKNKGRKEVERLFDLQGGKCFYCEREMILPKNNIEYSEELRNLWVEIDHKIPVSLGGKDRRENRVASCRECNRVKGDSTDEEYRKRQGYQIRQGYRNAPPTPTEMHRQPLPKTVHKEEPIKKNPEEESPLPPKTLFFGDNPRERDNSRLYSKPTSLKEIIQNRYAKPRAPTK